MRLSEFGKPADVPACRCGISPGRHCPMFGVGTVLRSIENITVIYVGTADCVFYGQRTFRSFAAAHHGSRPARVIGAMLTEKDLVFGIRKPLEALIRDEVLRFPGNSIYLVTSCSVEVISEDIGGLVTLLAEKLRHPITLIPTENFKTLSYYTGIENTLQALARDLKPCETVPGRFAVLGARYKGGGGCEPVRLLLEKGFQLQSVFPFESDREKLRELPSVSFNLVIDNCAVKMAEQLKADFGIDYVRFDEKLSPEKIRAAYEKLQVLSGLDLSPFLSQEEALLPPLMEKAGQALRGKRFIYSQILLYPMEACAFLTRLGAIPQCIFLGSVLDKSDEARQEILRCWDPEVWRNAQTEAILEKLRELRPDLYIGGMLRKSDVEKYHVRPVSLPVLPLECGYRFLRNTLACLTEGA